MWANISGVASYRSCLLDLEEKINPFNGDISSESLGPKLSDIMSIFIQGEWDHFTLYMIMSARSAFWYTGFNFLHTGYKCCEEQRFYGFRKTEYWYEIFVLMNRTTRTYLRVYDIGKNCLRSLDDFSKPIM